MSEAKKIDTNTELLKGLVGRYPLDWCVVYTNPKCERRAFLGMMQAGILAYLPQETFKRQQPKSKKSITVRKPVFTRYLFAGIDPARGQCWSDVRACDGVEGLVTIEESGAPYPLSAEEIVRLMERLNDAERIKEGSFIQVGAVLQLVKGVFSGFDVSVTAYEEGANRFKGEVALFGGKTPGSFDIDDVRR